MGHPMGSCVEGPDGGDDGFLLIQAEFGVKRQGQDFGGGALGLGKIAGLVAEVFERGLQVQRDRVVDFAADFELGEAIAEGVAARGADDVLVEDRGRTGIGVRQDDPILS